MISEQKLIALLDRYIAYHSSGAEEALSQLKRDIENKIYDLEATE